MKKLIFILIAIVISVVTHAQKPAVKSIPWDPYKNIIEQPDTSYNLKRPVVSTAKNLTSKLIGSSNNYVNTFLSNQQQQLSFNSTFNAVAFAHCGGNGVGNSNQVVVNMSLDGGTNWTINEIMYTDAVNLARYPSVALFNPSGNTNINDLYTIVAGPAVQSTKEEQNPLSNSKATYIAWKKRSATSSSQLLIEHNNVNRIDYKNFQICDNGKFYMSGTNHLYHRLTPNSPFSIGQLGFTLVSGTLNTTSNSVENVTTSTIDPPYLIHPTTSEDLGANSGEVIFNKSGTVGYFVFIGVRNDIPDPTYRTSYRPIVYKTTNGGTTWELQPDFNFDRLPAINENIQGVWQDEFDIRPNFTKIEDLVIDGNDNLHILSYIYGQYTSNMDSVNYVWEYQDIQGLMFDTYMSSVGWDATYIGSQNSKDIESTTGSSLKNTSRLQGMPSSDGNLVLYTWADSDTAETDVNCLPDVYLSGRHVDSANVVTPVNLTSSYDANMWMNSRFHSVTPIVEKNDEELNIRLVTTDVVYSPANFYYLKNVQDYNTFSIVPQINILNQPPSFFNIIVDSNALLSVEIDTAGNAPTYQWQYNNGNMWSSVVDGIPSGARYINPTSNQLKVEGIDTVGSYEYRCSISIRKGVKTVNSGVSTITVYELKDNQPNVINSSRIYPNPATDKINIEIEGNSSQMGFEVINSIGQVVFKSSMLDKTTIETSTFAKGIYLIKFENGDVYKFVKTEANLKD